MNDQMNIWRLARQGIIKVDCDKCKGEKRIYKRAFNDKGVLAIVEPLTLVICPECGGKGTKFKNCSTKAKDGKDVKIGSKVMFCSLYGNIIVSVKDITFDIEPILDCDTTARIHFDPVQIGPSAAFAPTTSWAVCQGTESVDKVLE